MANVRNWTAEDIPDQDGKVALVTGGNSGLGFQTVKALAQKRAQVVLACRNLNKGDLARDQILQLIPDGSIQVMRLDLADLASIREFATKLKSQCSQLHILVNNAGVMATPRRLTADGFELQFGTNHLGHFALTGVILELLMHTPQSRVVSVSSLAERMGRIKFNDLTAEKFYERWTAYGQSKLANLLFAYELQRRFQSAGVPTISLAAHPGFASSNLRSELRQADTPFFQRLLAQVFDAMTQTGEMGTLPQLYAATAPGVQGGEYFGPSGFLQIHGYPSRVRSSRQSYNKALAQRLWQVSEELTGVTYGAISP